jgi:hypothetical protein
MTSPRTLTVIFLVSLMFCSFTRNQTIDTSESLIPLISPPKSWELIQGKSLSPRVEVGFVKKASSGLCPSINLAVEEINCSEHQYIQAVKKLYEEDRDTRWRDLGQIQTRIGKGKLTEIDMPSKWGPIRMVQLIFIHSKKAYIVTAAAPKKEFAKYHSEFDECLSSFTLTDDLYCSIESVEKKDLLKDKVEHLKHTGLMLSAQKENNISSWEKECSTFEKFISENFADLGLHWQLLIMKSALEQARVTIISKDA